MDNRDKGYTLFKKGLKYKEIAEKLGVPESTVKSWATRYWKKGKVASEKVASKKKKLQPRMQPAPRKKVVVHRPEMSILLATRAVLLLPETRTISSMAVMQPSYLTLLTRTSTLWQRRWSRMKKSC